MKDAQRFLQRAKQEAREIAQLPLGNPHPLIQVSGDGSVLFANPAALDVFTDLQEQGGLHPVLCGIVDGVARRGHAGTREVVFGGRVFHQTISPAQVDDEDALIVYCYDITERKVYEKQLQASRRAAEEARGEAEKANQARGDFLANMSHELRTPMNGIIGLSDILAGAGLKVEHKEMIEAVNNSARNLLILLNDLLDFAKIEAGELSIEAIPFDLRQAIRQIERLHKPVAGRKGLEMKAVVHESVPACLVGDPSRLQQILNNLIGNALKFTEKGSVTLDVEAKEQQGGGQVLVRIAVRDTGIGIPADKQDKVFAKFQQADTSTARKYGGTGLGLAITKDLVELMGGRISLESEEGVGTAFTVVFLAAVVAEEAVLDDGAAEACEAEGGLNVRANIMVVDDHPVNLLYLRKSLESMGFQDFDEAGSGPEALALFQARDCGYDLILLDCQMPEMSGFEVVGKIRAMEVPERRPVVVGVTADAMKGAAEKCKAAGMDDYISKPVERAKLEALLRRWLPGDAVVPVSDPDPNSDSECGAAAVFDWDHLREFTGGDREAEKEILGIFMECLEHDMQNLERSFRAGDYECWDRAAHKLYGACSHIGAYAMAEICDEAQALSVEQTDKIQVLHAAILDRYRQVHDFLKVSKAA